MGGLPGYDDPKPDTFEGKITDCIYKQVNAQ